MGQTCISVRRAAGIPILLLLPQFDFGRDFETLRYIAVELLRRLFRLRGDRGEDDGAADGLGGEMFAGRYGGRVRRGKTAAAEECGQSSAARGSAHVSRFGGFVSGA